ncbi:hypothetical protein D3C85_1567690 [compost metagenome]
MVTNCGDQPIPLNVLIKDTMQVMKMDSSNGITHAPYRAGSLGIPKTMVDLLEAFME